MSSSEILNYYLAAVQNEIEIDKSVYRALRLVPEKCSHLPRPSRWSSGWPRFRVLIRFGGLVARILWIAGGAVVYYAGQAWLLLHGIKNRYGSEQTPTRCSGFLLAFSGRAADIIPVITRMNDLQVVAFPWVPLDQDINVIDIRRLLRTVDLAHAGVLAVRAVYRIAFGPNAAWVLQSFTAFQWFCARIAIDKLDGDFYISEHYDRWAVLADSAIARSNAARRRRGEAEAALYLIQHGSIGNLFSVGERSFSLRLPYRLRSVRAMWVYDEDSRKAFTESILSRPIAGREPIVNYFRPSIITDSGLRDGRTAVLFVGHPACESLHAYFHDLMEKKYDLQVFYKPHPLHPAGSAPLSRSWTVIGEARTFPAVDLVVSYPSTLVTEYYTIGVDAYVHPINPCESEYPRLWAGLNSALGEKTTKPA